MDDAGIIALIGTIIVTPMTVIIAAVVQWKREARNRLWDTEDRERIAKEHSEEQKAIAVELKLNQGHIAAELKVDQRSIAAELKVSQKAIAAKLNEHTAVLVSGIKDDIAANTEISTKAFHEANTVNNKLEKIGLDKNLLAAAIKKDLER